ncbi:unnamed protein product, partial [Prorocentrum cordatum]
TAGGPTRARARGRPDRALQLAGRFRRAVGVVSRGRAMPLNSKIYMPMTEQEPPKSKYESTMNVLDFCKRAGIDKTVKKHDANPPKHIYEHPTMIRWQPEGGPEGKSAYVKKK